MKKIDTRFITKTAMIVALAVVFQFIGNFIPPPINQFFTGILVNACLVVATGLIGIWGGGTVALLTPLTAMLTSKGIAILYTPFIALGNLALVVMFSVFIEKKKLGEYSINNIIGIITGAMLKFVILFWTITKLLPVLKVNVPAPFLLAFSWPQLITALVGGLIGLGVLLMINRNGALKGNLSE